MATVLSRNPRTTFEIHNDETTSDVSMAVEPRSDGEEDEEPHYEEDSDSDGSDRSVNASILEDMRKFEDDCQGIKERFRLINRIGEGQSHHYI